MSYELAFHPEALKEWGKLDASVRTQFKKKLAERLLRRFPAKFLPVTKSFSTGLTGLTGFLSHCF